MRITVFILLIFASCQSSKKIEVPKRYSSLTGNDFYHAAFAMKWKERDSFAVKEILNGNLPGFFMKFQRVQVSIVDSISGKTIHASYFVSPDYLSIGTNDDWARVELTPMAAQKIADNLYCFLPTRKMVDDIYKAAKVKLDPVPLFAFRDSTPIMWHHHLIIEGQRKGKKGLISGIKKDVVITGKISRDPKPDRVAIYGWHKLDGKPIQPLYTGHVNWYVDYSHGIRLVWKKIKVGKSWMDYKDVLKDPVLNRLLCDEEWCDYYKYSF